MASVETLSDEVSMATVNSPQETENSVPTARAGSHAPTGLTETDSFKFISTREVVELIPIFDGHNLPVKSFIRCCKSAESLAPPSGHAYLLQLIRSRIRGNADAFLGNRPVTNISELLNELKRAYAPTRSISQYQIDLSMVRQRENEIVFDYGMRVSDILSKGLESIYDMYPSYIAEGMTTGMKDCALKSFIRGLKGPLELRMNGRPVKDLNSAIDEAINIEHEVEQRKQLIDATIEKTDNLQRRENFKRLIPHSRRFIVNHMTLEDVICHRCQKKGHFARNCMQNLSSIGQRNNEKRKYPFDEQKFYKRSIQNNNHEARRTFNNQACQTDLDLNSRAGR